MSQELEIEFKNLLTKDEFAFVRRYFSLQDDHFTKQVNYYFDTHHYALTRRKCALRIRQKMDTYEMTLKQPQNVGLLESNDLIPEREARLMIKKQHFPVNAKTVQAVLDSLNIHTAELVLLGQLSTYRAEIQYRGGLLVVDHNCYLGTEDYELEYEVQDVQDGKTVFDHLLKTLTIPNRDTATKMERFFQEKRRQDGFHLVK